MTARALDLVLAALLAALVFLFGAAARALEYPGRVLPAVLLAALALLSGALAAGAVRSGPGGRGRPFAGVRKRRVAGMVAGSAAYLAAVPWLGFYVSSLVFLLAGAMGLTGAWRRPRQAARVALMFAAVVVVIYATFWLFLKVPTPPGVLL